MYSDLSDYEHLFSGQSSLTPEQGPSVSPVEKPVLKKPMPGMPWRGIGATIVGLFAAAGVVLCLPSYSAVGAAISPPAPTPAPAAAPVPQAANPAIKPSPAQQAPAVAPPAHKMSANHIAVLTFTPGARNGRLALPDGEVFDAGAGNGAGRDNPELVFVKNTGSPPSGTYQVDAPKIHGFLMKDGTTDYRMGMSLLPTAAGQMGERREIVKGRARIVPIRTQIDLHATHNTALASIGCVVVFKSDMDKIVAARKAGIFDQLRVVYDFGPMGQYAHRDRRHKVPTQLALN